MNFLGSFLDIWKEEAPKPGMGELDLNISCLGVTASIFLSVFPSVSPTSGHMWTGHRRDRPLFQMRVPRD